MHEQGEAYEMGPVADVIEAVPEIFMNYKGTDCTDLL
jgi:hypothetical protein